MVGVKGLTFVTNLKLERASFSRYIEISTPRISVGQKAHVGTAVLHRAEVGSLRTSRSFKRASTSDTSHQFSIRQSDPNRPGIVNRYDLNKAV